MTLRDLPASQISALQRRCNVAYQNFKEQSATFPKTELEMWQTAYSRGSTAALALIPKPKEEE